VAEDTRVPGLVGEEVEERVRVMVGVGEKGGDWVVEMVESKELVSVGRRPVGDMV